MVKYKNNDGFHFWMIDNDSKQTLVKYVIPAMVWSYGGYLNAINDKEFRDVYTNKENFCGKVSYLYELLEHDKSFWMDIEILGCKCTVWLTAIDDGYEMKIGAYNDHGYENEMVNYIEKIFEECEISFCIKGRDIYNCRYSKKK